MELLQGIGILVLGLVFALAAIAKLADREGTRQGLVEFGVPIRMAGWGGRVLPLVEAVLAVMILVPGTARAGAACAALMLLVFTALVAYQLARGRKPGCRCFGHLSDAAVGPRTLVRNVALFGLALGVAVPGEGRGLAALAALATGGGWYGALALLNSLLLVAVAWVGLGVWQQQGRLMRRITELEAARGAAPSAATPQLRPALAPGSLAPDFRAPAIAGGDRSLADLLDPARSTLLLFFDAACGPCDGMLRKVAGWQRSHAGRLRIVPIFSGEEDAVRARAKIHRLEDVLIQRSFEVGDAFGVPGTPGAVLLNPEARVQSPVLAGEESISRLLDAVVIAGSPSAAPGDSKASRLQTRAAERSRDGRRAVGGTPVLQQS